jgi:hypothetical protein
MHRPLTLFIVALLTGTVGFVAGWGAVAAKSAKRAGRVVAVSWGDASHAKAFYGAFVYLRQKGDQYSVRGRVYLGRDGERFYDCGELARVQTPAEAVQLWGAIEWKPDGVTIGSGTNRLFITKAQLERSGQ